ncbi:biotin/lipoyl-containing protein [Anaeromyxobacter diazotrophicus]|uniref:Acetyl-CoA carboxylase biotin carboxyl carrier protein subunit n=1 Tax=Anaeromyxobacter diazotrophicus TaxID=2590199 RepID=A0A7I9VSY2_9BACT|nr:acetyl-CoA carboxylase biotin carboxyl carrier protein subunit [Anaeromyxobacter diazotrophicus]GEJ59542.1 acetyl-CoA carboxylase biotin carboxyl carrier protein subunit [Anaeromyxobacter diazotrophicus]
MSTYVALLDGGRREETVEVEPDGPGLYRVRLGGQSYRVDAFRHDYGTVSLLVDGASYSAQLDQGATAVKVWIRGDAYPLEILDERRLRMRRAAGKFTVEGRQTLASPMPGKVVKVLARAGDEVREGQGLVVIEAMKMENELRSPKAGKLVELAAVEGQAVESGATLAVIE